MIQSVRLLWLNSIGLLFITLHDAAATTHSTSPANHNCLAKIEKTWLRSEQYAWLALCGGKSAYFGKSADARSEDLDILPNFVQPSRPDHTLRIDFLRRILTDPSYYNLIPNASVLIEGADISSDSSNEIINAHADQLYLMDTNIGDLELVNPVIRDLSITDGRTGNIIIKSGKVETLYLRPREANDITLEGLEMVGSLTVSGRTIRGLYLNNTHIHSDFSIYGPSFGNGITISNCFIDGDLDVIDHSIIPSIAITDSKIKRSLNLDRVQIINVASIEVSGSEISYIVLPPTVPRTARLQAITFSSWLNELPETITYLTQNEYYDPKLFDKIAASFREHGNYTAARKVLYLKANADFKHSEYVNKALMFISWATVGYGLYPEVGLAWIGLLVLCGFMVFRRAPLASDVRPRSWFVYSIDMVIPLIELDARNKEVVFAGWEQYFVYVMRIFSAVLAFLVFKILQNTISGA